MKRALIILAIILIAGIANAEEVEKQTSQKWHHSHKYTDLNTDTDTHADVKEDQEPVLGVKADAPNLIKLTKDWAVGVEGGKDLYKNSIEDGWFAFVKVTFSGSLFDLTK